MKNSIVVAIILFGLYWLFGHTAPFPFNHEQLGLPMHDVHRVMGIILLAVAALVAWKWRPKK